MNFYHRFSPDIKKDGDSITVGTATSILSNNGTRLTQGGIFLIALLRGGDYDEVGHLMRPL